MKILYTLFTYLFCTWTLVTAQTASLGGTITAALNDTLPLAAVTVYLIDDTATLLDSTVTDTLGRYKFTDLPTGELYRVEPSRTGDDLNGISTLDMVLVRQHILGDNTFDSPFQYYAADVNNSQNISTIDMVLLRKLILGINAVLPNERASWRFVRSTIQFTTNNPFGAVTNNDFTITLTEDTNDFDFLGIKIGDVNGSAHTP